MTRKIVYSVETLHHFSCECGKWFSIADWQQTDTLTCPSCGFRAEVEPIKQTIKVIRDPANKKFMEHGYCPY